MLMVRYCMLLADWGCEGRTEGNLVEDHLLILGVNGCCHVRGDEAGGHCIACDAPGRKLAGHSFCQADDSCLCQQCDMVKVHILIATCKLLFRPDASRESQVYMTGSRSRLQVHSRDVPR